MTIEELAARVADLEQRLERLTLRFLQGPESKTAARRGWAPGWAPPKEERPRCVAKTKTGKPCGQAVIWDRSNNAPAAHGHCMTHHGQTSDGSP